MDNANEQVSAKEAAEILGVGVAGIARTMARNGITRFTDQKVEGSNRMKITYDGAAVRILATDRESRSCQSCGAPVPNYAHVTCGRQACQDARRLTVCEAKNAAAKKAREDWSNRTKLEPEKPHPDHDGRARIISSWRASPGANYSKRLMHTAQETGSTIATVLGVLHAMGERA